MHVIAGNACRLWLVAGEGEAVRAGTVGSLESLNCGLPETFGDVDGSPQRNAETAFEGEAEGIGNSRQCGHHKIMS